MPHAVIDGIDTAYDVVGSGPPLLLFSPGGFNAVRDNWNTLGVYRGMELLPQLAAAATCISFDRRESGLSGGRLERIEWDHFVAQGIGLLDHLGIDRAVLMGGCIGCSMALRTAVRHPDRVAGVVAYSPAGGARYRLSQHRRFARHLAYVDEHGLGAVVELAHAGTETFSTDPRVGPWAAVIRGDEAFATAYAAFDVDRYRDLVSGMARLQFDRDSVPGVEAEDLLTLDVPVLIVPGDDTSHTRSAAWFLRECLPAGELWDVPVAEQTADTAPARIIEFLARVGPDPVTVTIPGG